MNAFASAIAALMAVLFMMSLCLRHRGAEAAPLRPPYASEPLPLDHPSLNQRHGTGRELIVEQVHLSIGAPSQIIVSWVTQRGASLYLIPAAARRLLHHHHHHDDDDDKSKDVIPSMVANCASDRVRSVVQYGESPGDYIYKSEGYHTCYTRKGYSSGLLHTAVVGNCGGNCQALVPGRKYFYRVGDPSLGWSGEMEFVAPPASELVPGAPATFAVFGDIGQTVYSLQTLGGMRASTAAAAINVGDLSYADGDQARWDAWGRLIQPVMSRIPMMPTAGNHEVDAADDEPTGSYIPFQAYTLRFPVPHLASGSGSPLYYSFNMAGVHFVMLGSYTDYDEGSPQYRWLQADLAAMDRSVTPWLVAAMHKPWYCSNKHHLGSGDDIAAALEPLLWAHSADVVFQGHVHAYERTFRIHDYELDECGPVYITVGDGGNRDGLDKKWADQPKWSAFREDSYGFGTLEVVNATHMAWQWVRNQDAGRAVAADSVWIVKHPLSCGGAEKKSKSSSLLLSSPLSSA